MATSLAELQSTAFRTTKHADDLNSKLMGKLGLKARYEPARLAIARSLAAPDQPPLLEEVEEDESGKAIKGENLFGTGADLAVWAALLIEHTAPTEEVTRKTFQDLVRHHWHRGIDLLWAEWTESKEDFDRFVMRLTERAGMREGKGVLGAGRNGTLLAGGSVTGGKPVPVRLRLGEIGIIDDTGEPAEWVLNQDGHSPHLGVFGKAGKGKTRLAKNVLQQVTALGVPIIVIDPKGDLREDAEFARSVNATVILLGQQPIPLDALAPSASGESGLIRVADGLVDALSNAVPEMGPKQQDSLREVAKKILATNPAATFDSIVKAVEARYAQNKQKADVLTATLHKLKDYRLFERTLSPADFFSKSWIISVNEVQDEALRFAMLFLLDALLRYLRAGPDAQVDRSQGIRAVRMMLAIDEARRVVELASNSMLEGLVLECRSKGLSCFFISQSPDHLDRASDDIVRQFEVAASFEADLTQRAARRVLGSRASPDMVQQLKIGTCLARLPSNDWPVVVRAWQPHEGVRDREACAK